jgi:formylglycine-generating enzyme required for sulfatase activity
MGSRPNETGRKSDEKQHRVSVTYGFYMQTTEVTQGQWKAVIGETPQYIWVCPGNCPVERVSWHNSQRYVQKLNELEGTYLYRLPMEAEWEYASRAGSETAFANGIIKVFDCGSDATRLWLFMRSMNVRFQL